MRGAGSSEPVPVLRRDGAGQSAQQRAVVADDGHLGAVHPEGDAPVRAACEPSAAVDTAKREAQGWVRRTTGGRGVRLTR